MTFPCAVCGKPKSVTAGYTKKNISGRYFCSEECRRVLGTKPRRKALVTCEICSTEFYPAGTNNRGRFCSKACYDKWQVSRSARVTYACDVCGDSFERKPSQVRDNAKWCSIRCRGIGRTTNTFEDRWHNGKPVRQNDQGYLLIYQPDQPHADKSGWVLEHRFVVSHHLGRSLATREQVHHVDGTKTNNALSNLEVLDASSHTAVTLREGSMRRRIAQKRIQELEAQQARDQAELAELRKRLE